MPTGTLDATFAALADPTRRAILARLASGEASVNELAEPFDMTLPGVSKHLKVLERAGLISRSQVAQSRPCRLEEAPLRDDAGTGRTGLAVTRVFAAPRELVFRSWTEPERLKRWWGPKGFTTPFCSIDLREGGVLLYCMRSSEGRDFWGRGVFREIVVPERLVLAMSFADAEGNVVLATYYGLSPDWPLESLMTVTFEELAGATRVAVRDEGVPPGPDADGTRQGWAEMLDGLAAYLAKA